MAGKGAERFFAGGYFFHGFAPKSAVKLSTQKVFQPVGRMYKKLANFLKS